MSNKLPLNPIANAIRNTDNEKVPFEKKQEIINVLKKHYNYEKDGYSKNGLRKNLNSEYGEGFENQTTGEISSQEVSSNVSETQEQFTGMSKDQIQKAIERNHYDTELNTPDEIREVGEKLNYNSEDLGNGRVRHTINGKEFVTPESEEFDCGDMKVEDKYTMDGLKSTEKFSLFQKETGIKEILEPEKVYEILGEVAQTMGITESINAEFFKNSEYYYNMGPGSKLLQMFKNITGFEGRIPIDTPKGKYVECLCCRDSGCWYDYYSELHSVSFFSR